MKNSLDSVLGLIIAGGLLLMVVFLALHSWGSQPLYLPS